MIGDIATGEVEDKDLNAGKFRTSPALAASVSETLWTMDDMVRMMDVYAIKTC